MQPLFEKEYFKYGQCVLLTESLRMNDQSKMLLIQNSIELLQSGIQRDFLEGLVRGLGNRIVAQDISFQNFCFEASKRSNSFNFPREL